MNGGLTGMESLQDGVRNLPFTQPHTNITATEYLKVPGSCYFLLQNFRLHLDFHVNPAREFEFHQGVYGFSAV